MSQVQKNGLQRLLKVGGKDISKLENKQTGIVIWV